MQERPNRIIVQKPNEKFRQARKDYGLTQQQLADELQVDVQTIARWEKGENIPIEYQRRRLVKKLGRSEEDLGWQKSQKDGYESEPSLSTSSPTTFSILTGEEAIGTQAEPFVSQTIQVSSPQDQLHLTKDDSSDTVSPGFPLKMEDSSQQETVDEKLPTESSVTGQPISSTPLLVRSSGNRWFSSRVFTVSLLVIALLLLILYWIFSVFSSIWRIIFSILILVIGISIAFFWAIRHTKYQFNRIPFSQQRRMLFLNAGISAINLAGGAGLLSLLFQPTQKNLISPSSLKILSGHTAGVTSLAWSPDGIHLASGSQDKTIIVWNMILVKNVVTLYGHNETVSSLAWSPDGTHLVSGSWDHTVKIWDAKTGANLATYIGHPRPVNSVTWSEDGKYIASGSSRPDADVKIWDSITGTNIQSYSDDKKNVHCVAWSHDSTQIASGTDLSKVYIHRIGEQQPILTYQGHDSQINTLVWAPVILKKPYIASGSGACSISDNCTPTDEIDQRDTSIHIWNAETGQDILALPYQGHSTTVTTIAWSPDGRYIASGSADPHPQVQVWNAATGKKIFTYSNHKYNVYTVVWAPPTSSLRGYIASGGTDSNIHVWQPQLI